MSCGTFLRLLVNFFLEILIKITGVLNDYEHNNREYIKYKLVINKTSTSMPIVLDENTDCWIAPIYLELAQYVWYITIVVVQK